MTNMEEGFVLHMLVCGGHYIQVVNYFMELIVTIRDKAIIFQFSMCTMENFATHLSQL